MDIRQLLYNVYWKFESLIVPTLKDSQHMYEQALNGCVTGTTDWLDVGCGHQLLPGWRIEAERSLVRRCRLIVGIDSDDDSLKRHGTITNTVQGDIARLPFPDGSFNLVTANMVVEHLENPIEHFIEINRVLKTGGLCIFHTPNVRGYTTRLAGILPECLRRRAAALLHGRKEDDIYPAYYRLNSEGDIVGVSQEAGFRVSSLKFLVTSAQFAVLAPLAIIELFIIRMLMNSRFKKFRPNILVVLEKTGQAAISRVSPL